MIELTEIMRQKNDEEDEDGEDICCIQSRSISLLDSNYPSDALHIWVENSPVDQQNNTKFSHD